MCPRPESNRDLELRRFSFYPLNYKDFIKTLLFYNNNFVFTIKSRIFFDKGGALNYNKHRITFIFYLT